MSQVKIGVIGGSGLYKMEGLKVLEEKTVDTPFGKPSDEATILKWVDMLFKAGIQTNVRANRGRDILAACGQLAA